MGRDELWASEAMAALGVWMLQISLQKWSITYRSDELFLYMFLPKTANSSQFISAFLATHGFIGMSAMWGSLRRRVSEKRRKMQKRGGSAKNVSISLWFNDLWSTKRYVLILLRKQCWVCNWKHFKLFPLIFDGKPDHIFFNSRDFPKFIF